MFCIFWPPVVGPTWGHQLWAVPAVEGEQRPWPPGTGPGCSPQWDGIGKRRKLQVQLTLPRSKSNSHTYNTSKSNVLILLFFYPTQVKFSPKSKLFLSVPNSQWIQLQYQVLYSNFLVNITTEMVQKLRRHVWWSLKPSIKQSLLKKSCSADRM